MSNLYTAADYKYKIINLLLKNKNFIKDTNKNSRFIRLFFT